MEKIQRYRLGSDGFGGLQLREDELGQFVKFADHESKLREMREALELCHRHALKPFGYEGTPACRKVRELLESEGMDGRRYVGTYACPICGCATPHAHSPEDIAE